MPWCPNCKVEYQQGFSTCVDCNVPLVEELASVEESQEDSQEDDQPLDMSHLTSFSDRIEAEIVESLLEANEIPVIKKSREAGGFLEIYMGTSNFGIDLYVPADKLEEACDIIESNRDVKEEDLHVTDEDDLESLNKQDKNKQKTITWIILLFFIPGLLWFVISVLFAFFYEAMSAPGLLWVVVIVLGLLIMNFFHSDDDSEDRSG